MSIHAHSLSVYVAVNAGSNGKKGSSSGVMNWISSACRFATDRNDFRRNLLVNLGLFAAGVWVARNLSDFDLSPQPVT
uniref:Translocase of outer mitochondrial membrane 6 homolog (yeast) n=1 Tax=Monopterus albus TaxID=43700 RepID=A0A3Q3RAP8_MONAL